MLDSSRAHRSGGGLSQYIWRGRFRRCDDPAAPVGRATARGQNTRPIRSLDDLAADTFEPDYELEEFLGFTYAERHRDLA
jgi:hypothetical protein